MTRLGPTAFLSEIVIPLDKTASTALNASIWTSTLESCRPASKIWANCAGGSGVNMESMRRVGNRVIT